MFCLLTIFFVVITGCIVETLANVDIAKPVYVAGAVSVADSSIGQKTPCGVQGKLSLVVGKSPSVFQQITESLVPSSIEFEMRHRFLCGWSVEEDKEMETIRTTGILPSFNIQCHRRRLFGGCSPIEVLQYHNVSHLVENNQHYQNQLPRSLKICNSKKAEYNYDTMATIYEHLFSDHFQHGRREIRFNVSQSTEEKQWQFHDGNSAKHFSTAFLEDTRAVDFYGDSLESFIENHRNRFTLYVCRGIILPKILVTTPGYFPYQRINGDIIEENNNGVTSQPMTKSATRMPMKRRSKNNRLEVVYVIVLSFFSCTTLAFALWKLWEHLQKRRNALNATAVNDDPSFRFSPLHELGGNTPNQQLHHHHHYQHPSTPSTITSAASLMTQHVPPSYEELVANPSPISKASLNI